MVVEVGVGDDAFLIIVLWSGVVEVEEWGREVFPTKYR
jgi:hypothetical protein